MTSGDNKNEDFWNTGGDDFWNKPVMDSEWKKTEIPSFDKNEQQASGDGYASEASEWGKEFDFYEQPRTYAAFDENGKLGTEEPKQKEPKQKKPISPRTVLCLFYLGAAILCLGGLFFVTKWKDSKINRAVPAENIEEIEAGNRFLQQTNNEILLEDEVYTIIEAGKVAGLPGDDKLVTLYVEVKSEEYIRDSYALENIYMGYGDEYIRPLEKRNILPYVMQLGFLKNHCLDIYGIGNGMSAAGYFFFLVPGEAENLTLYVEQRSGADSYQPLGQIYKKDFKVTVINESEMTTLTERGVYR